MPPAQPYIFAVTSSLYTRDVLRLAMSIPHLQRLESPQGSAEEHSAVCGSRVAVDIVLDANGRVAALGQEVRACALGQASAALLGTHAHGRTAADLRRAYADLAAFLSGEREDPGDWPGLEALTHARNVPARHSAILLPFAAAAEAARRALAEIAPATE